MKDWFYASGTEIVSEKSNTDKSTIVRAIKSGYKSVADLEKELGITFAEQEIEDVEYLIRIYGPLSYDLQSGCHGCDACAGKSFNQ